MRDLVTGLGIQGQGYKDKLKRDRDLSMSVKNIDGQLV